MRHGKLTTIALLSTGLLLAGTAALADKDSECASENGLAAGLKEARMEGQLWATYAVNEHLNPFKLKIDVDGDTATLEGRVDEDAKKELAGQIALSVDGISQVKNRIVVVEDGSELASDGDNASRGFGDRVRDATTTASVKSKLLLNRSTSGLAINVTTKNGVVKLEGEAKSEASRALAEKLAANTDGVRQVINEIKVEPEQHAALTGTDGQPTVKLLASRGNESAEPVSAVAWCLDQ